MFWAYGDRTPTMCREELLIAVTFCLKKTQSRRTQNYFASCQKGNENLNKQVLFIQGAGKGAYEEDGKLVKSLRERLGTEYNVRYPKMPEEEDQGYEAWKALLSKELGALEGNAILVGHSVGSSMLLKYLSEENVKTAIAGIFLIAAPYWGAGGWQMDEFTLDEGSASEILKGLPVFLYHSRDDDIVPFAHLAWHAEKFPQATIREFDGRGHQFNNDLSEVAADIKGL